MSLTPQNFVFKTTESEQDFVLTSGSFNGNVAILELVCDLQIFAFTCLTVLIIINIIIKVKKKKFVILRFECIRDLMSYSFITKMIFYITVRFCSNVFKDINVWGIFIL